MAKKLLACKLSSHTQEHIGNVTIVEATIVEHLMQMFGCREGDFLVPAGCAVNKEVHDGDVLLFRPGILPENGAICYVLIDGSPWIKRIVQGKQADEIVLCAPNQDKEPITQKSTETDVVGVCVGLLRAY